MCMFGQICLVSKDYSFVLKQLLCCYITSAFTISVLLGTRSVNWLTGLLFYGFVILVLECYCSHDLFWHFHKSSCSWELLLSVQMSLCLLLMTWQIKLLRFSTILGKDVNKNLLIIYYLITCWGLNSSLNQF